MTGAGELTPHGQFVFECVNLGRTPADLLDIRDDIVECEREQWPDPVIPVQNPRTLPPGTVASADRPYVFRINLRERVNVYVDNDKNLFFIGYVRYADVFGGTYLTGFCAIFDRIGMRFVLRGDHRYNYTRKESE